LKNDADFFDVMFIDNYNKNYVYLLKYLISLIGDPYKAEDFAHDIFVRIYKSKKNDLTGQSFRNYLKIAAKNIALDYMKNQMREDLKNKRKMPELDEGFYMDMDAAVIEGEVLSTVNEVLEVFSEKSRKIFVSRIIENKPRWQVSKEEKITPYAVKRLENEVIMRLREKLKDYLR
jgi:RNA polymerase sigma factor (sigma-70 family)